jgi:hypothetical protein
MHTYMEVPQETPWVAILNKQKCHFFFLSFAKSENRRAEQALSGRVDTSGRGEKVGKRYGRVNMMQILCTHECKCKKIPVETISQMGEGNKREWWRG